MARQSGKTMKVDIALPLEIYDTVVRLAEKSDAPIHHRSNQRVLSPTVLHLIGLGIQALKDNPELLTAPITTGNTGNDPRVGEVLTRLGKLEEKLKDIEPDSLERMFSGYVTRAELFQRLKDYPDVSELSGVNESLKARIEALEKAPIAKPPQSALAGDGVPIGEFAQRFNIPGLTRDLPAGEVRALLVKHGLDGAWEYFSKRTKFVRIGEGTTNEQ